MSRSRITFFAIIIFAVIVVVVERNDGVETIVAARELDHDQNVILRYARLGVGERQIVGTGESPGGALEEGRYGRSAADERQAAMKKLAAGGEE